LEPFLTNQGVRAGNDNKVKPSVLAGGLTALVTGGLMAALTASTGRLAGSLPAIVWLTLPLLAAGVAYGWLVDTERLTGGFGSGILFWTAAFPAARLAQEFLAAARVPDDVLSFVIYQALVGGAFGLGFLLLHNQISMLLVAWRRRGDASPHE
jgi:hypothetical protein